METSKLVHNERAKLTATFWNNFAIASFFSGILAPVVAAHRGVAFSGDDIVIVLGGFLLACAAHLYARRVLGALEA